MQWVEITGQHTLRVGKKDAQEMALATRAETSLHIIVEKGASLTLYERQSAAATVTLHIEIAQDAHVRYALYAPHHRQGSLTAHLLGKGAGITTHEALLSGGSWRSMALHDAQNTYSRLTTRALGTREETIIKGMISIAKKARHADARYSGKILAAEGIKAQVYPELEIKNKEVKAGHEASVSRIDAEHLFFLQSRGIGKQQAQALLQKTFLSVPEVFS